MTDRPIFADPAPDALAPWGRAGAGCLVRARATGRVLLSLRGPCVREPYTWGVWGGAVEPDEEPAAGAVRELAEETGLRIDPAGLTLLHLHEGAHGFVYRTYLAAVDAEFEPALCWENAGYGWFAPGDWPSPLHYGLAELLSRPAAAGRLRASAA